ncbi:MAG: hypothetical protein ACE5OR_05680 [bacterium]
MFDISYYTLYLIEGEIAQGSAKRLPELVSAWAEEPDRNIEMFFQVIELLMYHGHTEPLIVAMKKGWPKISTSHEIMSWGIEEFSDILSQLLIFDYLDRTENLKAVDPALQKKLQPFSKIGSKRLEQILCHLSGQEERTWNVSDFEVGMDIDQWGEQLFWLSLDFLSELRWNEGIPFSKGELGRTQLLDSLLCDEHLEEREQGVTLLYPCQGSFDCFLGQLFGFFVTWIFRQNQGEFVFFHGFFVSR